MLFEDAVQVVLKFGLKVHETGIINSSQKSLIDVICEKGHIRRMPRGKFSSNPPTLCRECLKIKEPNFTEILSDPKIQKRLQENYQILRAFSHPR